MLYQCNSFCLENKCRKPNLSIRFSQEEERADYIGWFVHHRAFMTGSAKRDSLTKCIVRPKDYKAKRLSLDGQLKRLQSILLDLLSAKFAWRKLVVSLHSSRIFMFLLSFWVKVVPAPSILIQCCFLSCAVLRLLAFQWRRVLSLFFSFHWIELILKVFRLYLSLSTK